MRPRTTVTTDDKPLQGRRIVVTRAADQSSELVARLEALGAQVLPLPLIEFAPPDDPGPLDRALAEFGRFDWLLLTSRNAVRFLDERARGVSVDLPSKLAASNHRPRVAAVGSATAAAARERGWRVDRVSRGRGSLDLVRELAGELSGKTVLLPRSHRAIPEMTRALADAGAFPVEVVAYRTNAVTRVNSEIVDRIARGEVDVVIFASPSAFSALVALVGLAGLRKMTDRARIATIGPTTTGAIGRSGLAVAVEAQVPTAAGLAEAVASYFAANPTTSGRTP